MENRDNLNDKLSKSEVRKFYKDLASLCNISVSSFNNNRDNNNNNINMESKSSNINNDCPKCHGIGTYTVGGKYGDLSRIVRCECQTKPLNEDKE